MKLLSTVALAISLVLPLTNANAVNSDILENIEMNKGININIASISELSQLKGVGTKKAQAIIAYREAHGEFESLDELLQVKGIGSKILTDNRSLLTI